MPRWQFHTVPMPTTTNPEGHPMSQDPYTFTPTVPTVPHCETRVEPMAEMPCSSTTTTIGGTLPRTGQDSASTLEWAGFLTILGIIAVVIVWVADWFARRRELRLRAVAIQGDDLPDPLP